MTRKRPLPDSLLEFFELESMKLAFNAAIDEIETHLKKLFSRGRANDES